MLKSGFGVLGCYGDEFVIETEGIADMWESR
jgi:hypothetical protein